MAKEDTKSYTELLTSMKPVVIPLHTSATSPGFGHTTIGNSVYGGSPYPPYSPGSPPPSIPTTSPRPVNPYSGTDYLPVLNRIADALEKIVERFC